MTRRLRLWPSIYILLFVILLSPAVQSAESTCSVTFYSLPAESTGAAAMALASNGDVWLIQNSPPVLYRFSVENNSFSSYQIKGFEGAGFASLNVDDEGLLWFADLQGNRVGAYQPETNETSSFDFPGPMGPSSVVRAGNTLWIGCKEEVGEYDLITGEFTDHFVYKMDSYLGNIHFDGRGNIWFVENAVNKVGVYFRTYDTISEFEIPTPDSSPGSSAFDRSGRLWFIETGPNKLGMYDTVQFTFTEWNQTVVDGQTPYMGEVATTGSDVWITDAGHGRLLKFHPAEGRFAAAKLGNNAIPTLIEADRTGNLWTYDAAGKKLGYVALFEGFGIPTATPEATPAPTPIPTAIPPATPTPAPGFELFIAIITLLAIVGIGFVKR